MQRQSPPKHRHDGTSPLPLGMDWSPPPRKWAGRDTVWPHDPRSGWSYCVTIPSWAVLAKSRDSDPIVFYRVLVGLQSPEGITSTRVVLRRFNDFLKLFAALKRAFTRKSIPPAPPKGLLRMKTRALLEERRCSLEEWMTKLLSDIDISRSAAIASFLELEVAARSSFQDDNQLSPEGNVSGNFTSSPAQIPGSSSQSLVAGTSSLVSEYGSDTAYEASEIGTPSLGRDNTSEIGTEDFSLDEDLTNPIDKFVKYGMSNIDEGLFMGQAILEQLEGFPKHKVHTTEVNNTVAEKNISNGSISGTSYVAGNMMELLSETEHGKLIRHTRELSAESAGSDTSSQRGSESSNSAVANSFGDGPLDLPRGSEVSKMTSMLGNMGLEHENEVHLVLPLDHRHKMNRALLTMQRRLATAKTDMEDLISRLNQEIAVKDYLTTKVKDLEVELETTKERNKENLEQAILVERERVTQMQWDMEELRRRSMEMELKLNSQEVKEVNANPSPVFVDQEKNALLQELDLTKQQLDDLSKRHLELEAKSKADIKVLVKEVKSLRTSQAQLKHQLSQSLEEKSEAERSLEEDRQRREDGETYLKKMLHEFEIINYRLLQCKIDLLTLKEDQIVVDIPSLSHALDLLEISDNQVSLLLAEVQHSPLDNSSSNLSAEHNSDDDKSTIDEKLKTMLANTFSENARLRKELNSAIRYIIKMHSLPKKDDKGDCSRHIVQNEHLD